MNTIIRSLNAGAIVVLMFGIPFAWACVFQRQTIQAIEQLVRSDLIAQGRSAEAAAFTFRPGVTGVGLELPAEVVTGIFLCDLLFQFWWLWLLTAIATGYGIFVFLGYWHGKAPSAPTMNEGMTA